MMMGEDVDVGRKIIVTGQEDDTYLYLIVLYVLQQEGSSSAVCLGR